MVAEREVHLVLTDQSSTRVSRVICFLFFSSLFFSFCFASSSSRVAQHIFPGTKLGMTWAANVVIMFLDISSIIDWRYTVYEAALAVRTQRFWFFNNSCQFLVVLALGLAAPVPAVGALLVCVR